MLRAYRIFLDDIEICKLKEGSEFTYEIAKGHHTLMAKIDWCGSRPLQFDARSDDVHVSVKSALRGWELFLLWVYLITRWDYIKLELDDATATPSRT